MSISVKVEKWKWVEMRRDRRTGSYWKEVKKERRKEERPEEKMKIIYLTESA